MSLNKVDYIDGLTVISAQNMNDIQDEIIRLGKKEAIQSNWLEQDKNSLAYIKNRPFGQAGQYDVIYTAEEAASSEDLIEVIINCNYNDSNNNSNVYYLYKLQLKLADSTGIAYDQKIAFEKSGDYRTLYDKRAFGGAKKSLSVYGFDNPNITGTIQFDTDMESAPINGVIEIESSNDPTLTEGFYICFNEQKKTAIERVLLNRGYSSHYPGQLSTIDMPLGVNQALKALEGINTPLQPVIEATNESLNELADILDDLKDEIPSVEGLASESYVNQAIAAIEIPSVEGLASESYVDQAIAAIEIPEAKANVNVYEISSDSTIIDELVTLLPEGVEINQGDVMIVTNDFGVKSAYQFDDSWIACDGNVDASKVIMPFDITLAGSYTQVGNLNKTSTGIATFATKGKSVAATLQEILSKREQPGIKKQPSVSLTATNGAKEVGTEITPTWNASLSAGEYTYGPATGIVAKTWSVSDTDGHSATTASGSFSKFTVGDNTNYRITVTATYDAGAIANDNLGNESNPPVRIEAGSKSANSSYITGYRAWFMYVGTSEAVIDSSFIRSTTNKGSAPATQNGVSIPAGTKRIMVAIPKGKASLTSVIDVDGMSLDVIGNFTQSTVNVEGLNGYTSTAYDVWVCENSNGLAATKYNLIIK